jgi:hypothetical protein
MMKTIEGRRIMAQNRSLCSKSGVFVIHVLWELASLGALLSELAQSETYMKELG